MEFDEEQYIVPRRIPRSIRSSMEFDEEQNIVLGRIPKCGAIFMSNSATKRECYRRGLFGLPSSQGHFVKQVKAGMILFLFEYERRQLHGVFQACSDGAMNIVPHAFTSSRMQFPAQVKFTPIWYCSPLTEDEFHDAIKENYFSSNKFNFGLSEDQVRRLLRLFSFRKLPDRLPQRQLKKSKFTRPIEYSRAKVRREVDDGGFVMNDKVKDVHDAHDNSRPIILTDEYPRESFGNVGRVIDDGRFAENHGVGNKPNEPGPVIPNEYLGDCLGKVGRDEGWFAVRDKAGSECNLATERGPVMSNDYPEFHLGKIGRVFDDVRFATSNRLGSEQNMDNSFVSPISTGYPCLFHSNCNESPYFSKPIQATESVIQDKLRQPSSFCGTTEPHISNPFYSTYFEDANAMNTLPYDPENASINSRRSSSFEIDHSTNSGQECPPHKTYFGTSIPSLKKQSYMPSVEPNGINRFPGSSSGCGNHVPFPTPNRYEHSHFMTSMPLSGSAFSENLATDSSKNQSYGCLSFPESSLPPVPTKNGNNGLENKVVSSYSSSPSIYPSYVYGVASQDKAEHEAARQENNEAFSANFPLSNEGQVQLQGLEDSFEPRNVNHHEHKSFNHDVNQYQTSENGFYGCQKNRNSVFSRLSLASDVYVHENGIDVGNGECDGDTSVDEVMAMLHQSHNQWEKTQKYKPLIRRHDHVVNFRNKKQTTFCSKLERDWLEMNLEEIKMNSTATVEQNVNQIAETCFVDFKRRSEVRKVHDDTKTRGCDEIAGSDGLVGGQLKRRKLIRPDFSKKESSDDKGINDDVSSNIEVSSQEGSVSKDKTGSCEVFIRSLDKENKLFESVELPHVICPISHKKISAEGGSNCKEELKAESCETSFRPRVIDGKESSQDVDIENHCKDKSHNAEEDMGIKDPVVHGVSQGCIDTSHSIMQQSFSEVQEENAEKGTLCVETELGRFNGKELLHSVEKVSELFPTRGEIAISNTMNSSSNQNSSSQMELLQSVEKVSELCPTSGEIAMANTTKSQMELLQSVEKFSELCPTSGEIAIGNTMNNSSTQKSTLQMELLQNVEKGSELRPTSGELSIGNTMNNSSNQHSTLQIDLPQSVEKVCELCPTSGEIAIGKTMNSSRNQNSSLQMMPEEPVCVYVDEGKRTSGSSTKQSEASLENVR